MEAAAPDLALLMRGKEVLREAGGEELVRLADLAEGRWSDAILAVSAQASVAAETSSQALAFAGEELPLSVAETFARAKTELDVAWSSVSSLPVWNRFESWSALIEVAREDAEAARNILELLAPCARSGVSTEEVFLASDEESEARAILERFAGSGDVRRMLGDLFDGADTDLDQLSQTQPHLN